MNDPTRLDEIRTAALDRIDRAERAYTWGMVAVAGMEAGFLIAFLLLMDFRDRLHWLLLVMALLIYGTLLAGIVNVGGYLKSSTQAILKAVFSLRPPDGQT